MDYIKGGIKKAKGKHIRVEGLAWIFFRIKHVFLYLDRIKMVHAMWYPVAFQYVILERVIF